MLSFMGENKRLLNIHEQNFTELASFQENTNVFLGQQQCISKEYGDAGGAAGPINAKISLGIPFQVTQRRTPRTVWQLL